MVTRKPVGAPPISTNVSQQPPAKDANPPYPTTPILESEKTTASKDSIYSPNLATSPAFDLIDMHEARQRSRSDSDASSHGTWDSEGTEIEDENGPEEPDMPKPLNVRASQLNADGQAEKKDELPASLRIGPADGVKPKPTHLRSASQEYEQEAQANPWAEQQSTEKPQLNGRQSSNNPYLKQNGFVPDNSQSAWQEVKPPPLPGAAPPPPPVKAPPPPVELSAVKSPSEELSEMSLGDHRPASFETAEVLPVPQKGQAPLPPVTDSLYVSDTQQDRPESTWWQEPNHTSHEDNLFNQPPAPPPKAPVESQSLGYPPPPPGPPPGQFGLLIDQENDSKSARPMPPPINTQQAASGSSSQAVPETPGTILKRQRNENYQIKHINWFDASHTANPRMKTDMRRSPILTQNANGPCPLLALVNALVLSTPSDANTALIETLHTREQISLGLLLDAVFDELMSGRRGDTAHQLPDVSELYSFLLALHTGMNVNPQFVTPATTPRGSLDGHPAALNSVHPMLRSQRKAGAFEETREMRLYSTFNIPLIHGWTAPADSPAYEAFARSAPTFEDAQNIQFAESELEDRMRSEGLPPQEQQTLQDIKTIRAFLDNWPTQLTDFGLQTISESLTPGQIAILFRNDHFSTIYKEPKHGALMTLVTDQGYSSHDEIVWESLVDVNGSASEMFAGDFRAVSHSEDVRLNQGNSGGGEEGWNTVSSRSRNRNSRNEQGPLQVANNAAASTGFEAPPPLPGPRPAVAAIPNDSTLPKSDAAKKAAEQEDHDLALALQLQEEEEDQQRQTEERQRRERELSERFLSSESEGPRPPIPPRRTAGRGASSGPNTAGAAATAVSSNPVPPAGRPAVNRPSDQPNDPEAPPSYEQAASDRPYRPAGSTASANIAQGNPLSAYDALRRQQSAYAQQSSTSVNTGGGGGGAQGPNSPPYTAQRRRSEVNRIRRRSSQMAGPSQIPGGFPGPGGYNGAPGIGRPPVGQAADVRQAEDRCVVM